MTLKRRIHNAVYLVIHAKDHLFVFIKSGSVFEHDEKLSLHATTVEAILIEFQLKTELIPKTIVYNPDWFPDD